MISANRNVCSTNKLVAVVTSLFFIAFRYVTSVEREIVTANIFIVLAFRFIQSTIIMGLLKNRVKILLVFIVSLAFTNCKAQEYSLEKLATLKPTHKIKNELINDVFKTIENNKNLFSNKSDCFYLIIKKIKSEEYKITATSLTFFDCKVLAYNNTEKLKGYIHYNEKTVFLYGDIDEYLFVRKKSKIKNILKSSYKVDKLHPPVSLHLTFLIKNNILTKENNID